MSKIGPELVFAESFTTADLVIGIDIPTNSIQITNINTFCIKLIPP